MSLQYVRSLGLCLALLIGLPALSRVHAAAPPVQSNGAGQGLPTPAQVAAELATLAQEANLDETQRAALTQRWQAVQAQAERAAAQRAQVTAWATEESEARAAVAAGGSVSIPGLPALPEPAPEGAPRATLDTNLAAVVAVVAEADARLAEIDLRQQKRIGHKAELGTLLAETRAALEAAKAESAKNGGEQDKRITALVDAERLARITELEATLAMHEADLAGFDLRGSTLERRARVWAALRQDATQRRAKLEQRLQAVRQREARDAELEAQRSARDRAGQHAVLLAIALQNEELTKRTRELVESTGEAKTELTTSHEDLASLEARRDATERREALAGGSQSIGSVLRRERLALPDMLRLEQRLARFATALSKQRLKQYDLLERQRELRLPDVALAKLVSETSDAPQLSESERELGLELLTLQGELVGGTLDGLTEALATGTELELTEAKLLSTALEYKDFIDERVLWVRSTEPLWGLDLGEFWRALAWGANPKAWSEIPLALLDEVARNPGWVLLYLLAVASLFAARRLLRQRDNAQRSAERTVTIGPTFAALARDVLAAAVWPVVVGVPAWMLAGRMQVDGRESDSFAHALASGALQLIAPLALLAFVRRIARPGGTGEQHFGWGQPNARLLRRVVIIGGPLYLAPMFIALVLQASGQQGYSDTLGRISFLTAVAAMLVGLRIIVREKGLSTPKRYRDEESWVAKLRPVWHLVGVGGSAALFALSLIGFDYTARQLHLPFERSLALMLFLMVVQGVAFRWLLLARRRIQIEQARARREAEVTAKYDEAAKSLEAEELPDLRSLGLELRRAVRAATAILTILGLYLIWRDEIPALGALDRIRLYPFRPAVEGEFVFTASKLLIVLLAIFATGAVARRLPGLLDFLLLDRTGLTAAERYAMRSVTQYIVITIGVLVALAQVGITWSQLQWLAAAVSVGLGFGLQEIFANFVSGLILLFERPIRVGDLVSINGMEGRVSNIRIRATTIVDYDRRELIVPNREFVTGSVINWTLSDPVTRVTVPVGVGYDSDVDLVHRLLIQAARETPKVLVDPKPHTVFRRFGDSALEFELRVFLGDRDHWIEVVNGAHARITALFRENGVEIPFPQRDVHFFQEAALVEAVGGATPKG